MGKRKKILVLGTGLIGFEIARCLAENYEVTAVDRNAETLTAFKKTSRITPVCADFLDEKRMTELSLSHDVVVGAMPGKIAYRALTSLAKAGARVVDISFFEEDPFGLQELARANGSTLVIDCGLAPGLGNLLLGYETTQMRVTHFEILSGGLPFHPTPPWQYKAPFAVRSVLDLWTRPVCVKVNGVITKKLPLTDFELIDIPGIGTLEAIPTDGLRTLFDTLHVPNMVEKTLRYPGHRQCLEMLRDMGMFQTEPIEVDGVTVIPIDVTSRLLEKQWRLADGDDEFTVLRIIMEGVLHDRKRKVTYELFDRRDFATGATSMARTTGYTCAAVAHLLAQGLIAQTGVIAPEELGTDESHLRFIMRFLTERNITFTQNEEIL